MLSRRWLALLPVAALGLVSAAQTPDYLNTKLSPQQRAHDLVSRMTLEEKANQLEDWATAIPRLGVPDYQTWNEALHGVARAGYATVFPQAIGMARHMGSRDRAGDGQHHLRRRPAPSTTRRSAKAITASSIGLTFWSPNINIFRDPRWGRGQETYGEDPFLTGRMGVAFVEGVQGNDLRPSARRRHQQALRRAYRPRAAAPRL